MSLVLDLLITHDRFGSSSFPSLNGHLHQPNDIDKSLNETVTDKIRKYRADYKNNPPTSILQDHRETDRFFESSGVQFTKHDRGLFHFHRSVFSSLIKKRVALALVKTTTLRLMINIDGVPITSKSHTHPSHSQTSRPLTSSLSLGVPVPRATQCLRDTQIPQL